MGGRGSGGFRVGAGDKPKPEALKHLHGTSGKPVELPPVEVFAAPDGLDADTLAVWNELAPFAFQARTLVRATVYAFVLLCKNVVLERKQSLDADQIGGANHRGIIQRIDAELARFCLTPMGKPLTVDAPKVEDPFAEFDGPVN